MLTKKNQSLGFSLALDGPFQRNWGTLMILLLTCCLATHAEGQEASQSLDDVTTILRSHCAECHAGEESEGGFSINSRALLLDAQVVEVGDSAKSVLIDRVSSQDPNQRMPPEGHEPLTAAEVTALREWIDLGLAWPAELVFDSQRYEPPLLPRIVTLPPGDENRNPIDRILAAYFRDNQIEEPELIDDRRFARRLCYDVIGLPPSSEDLTFETRQELIDSVLRRDQAFAEHWMTFWNDLLRNAYSGTGYIDDGRRQITGWLYGSLLNNKPYDEFVRELISPPDEQSIGFVRGIRWRGNVNASQTRDVQFAQSVSQVFLGINLKCASCHDSFIDDWSLDEAYGLAAIYATEPLEVFRCDTSTGRIAQPRWLFPEIGQIDAEASQSDRMEQLAGLMVHPQNGRLTRTIANRIWTQLMGRGIVHPVDAMHNAPWNEDLLDYLANYLVEQDYDVKALIRLIVSSDAYQSAIMEQTSEINDDSFRFSGPVVRRLTVEQLLDTIWTMTNSFPKPDAKAFKLDGRKQGGQLAAVLLAHPENETWEDRNVRAVFTPLDPFQQNLGRPNREQVVTSRPTQVSTLEAVDLVNGPALTKILQMGANNLREIYGDDKDRMIDHVYLIGLSRAPSDQERELSHELMSGNDIQTAIEDLLWSVVMLPEFQYIR